MKIITFLVSLVVFSFVFMPKFALANVSGAVGQSGAASQATSGVTVTTTTPAATAVPTVTTVQKTAPAVVTVPTTTTVQQLPQTGPAPITYLLVGLVPVGIKLIRYKWMGRNTKTPLSLWEERQFKF